jgi:signal transduction histidine kinase
MESAAPPTAVLPPFQAWIEATGGAVAWVSADGTAQATNRRWQAWLGLTAPRACGRPQAEVLSEALAPRLARPELLAPLLDGSGGDDVSLELPLSSGGLWRFRRLAVRCADGTLHGWRDTLRDESELGELRDELAVRLHEKERLLARVSHDLRTPLTAIIGFCHMLLAYSGPLEDQQVAFVQKILKNGSILLQLINNVLDLAKITEGQMNVVAERVDIQALLRDVMDTVEPQSFERQLALRLVIDPDVPDLLTDRLKLKLVLINLLSNAVKYTLHGHVTLSAELIGERVKVCVADTGVGIPANQLERIFDPYVTVRNPEHLPGVPSTGLGLTICRALAELLQADLSVESELGAGSCFTLVLPLQLATETVPPPA